MSSYFKDRNFPPSVVENAFSRIACISRTSALTSPLRSKDKDRIPLVLTYHPTNLQIQRIILRYFWHLQSDPTTKDIFPSAPLSAFHRDRSLHDPLVCSTLPTSPTTPDTFPCNCRKGYTCPCTSPLTSIQGTKRTFHIRQRFTCTFASVVYCIRCGRCGYLYVGGAQRRLGDRFVEHLRSVHDKRHHLPVAKHFNSSFHSLGDMSILGLLQCHNDATQKLEEQ
eukprot:g17052.t1